MCDVYTILFFFSIYQCSALGATFCYFLSAMVGHGLVKKYCPERLKSWKAQIGRHHDDMLWYIMFLRITPFLPNWFINLASPVIGVRLMPFFWGTFLGIYLCPSCAVDWKIFASLNFSVLNFRHVSILKLATAIFVKCV